MAARITFDRTLYLPDAVEAAAAAYAEHASIRLTPVDGGVEAALSDPVGHDLQTLIDAFCNHVLYETIARRRQVESGQGA